MFMNMGPPEIGINCSMEECIHLAKTSGFAGVDVDMYEAVRLADEKGTDYVKGLFDNTGMKIGGWIWFDHFGFEDDEAAFQDHLKALPSLAQMAERIGATRVLSWILPYSDELSFEKNFVQHVARIRAATEILGHHGQELALEFIGPKTFRQGHAYEFISNLDGALELIGAVGAGNLGLIMDSWHWYTSYGTVADIRKLSSDMVIYVHVSDAPANTPVDEQIDDIRRLPGATGVIDNAAFLQSLHEIGYDGPVTAEPFSTEVNALPAEEAARATAKALAELWKQAGLASPHQGERIGNPG